MICNIFRFASKSRDCLVPDSNKPTSSFWVSDVSLAFRFVDLHSLAGFTLYELGAAVGGLKCSKWNVSWPSMFIANFPNDIPMTLTFPIYWQGDEIICVDYNLNDYYCGKYIDFCESGSRLCYARLFHSWIAYFSLSIKWSSSVYPEAQKDLNYSTLNKRLTNLKVLIVLSEWKDCHRIDFNANCFYALLKHETPLLAL